MIKETEEDEKDPFEILEGLDQKVGKLAPLLRNLETELENQRAFKKFIGASHEDFKAFLQESLKADRDNREQTAEEQRYFSIKILGFAFLAVVVALIAVGHFSNSSGKEEGYQKGLNEGRAQDSWVRSPEGEKAFKMSKNGTLSRLIDCSIGKNWQIQNGNCYPFAEKTASGRDSYSGWRLPE